nr:MAG TPA: hypothetical protein [Caudoviricetes sp.]
MNKIEIPKEIFENIFFAEGGEKKQLNKALTGEYQFALDSERPIAEPNAEIEGGEYLLDSQGVRKAEGKSHERGGMPVKLEEGTKIISNHLKVGVQLAKYLSDILDIRVKATDTYSKVLDKYTSKSGLKEKNDELEKYINLMEKEKKNPKNKDTSNLNISYISKKINELTNEKKPLEEERLEVFNMIFQAQEQEKEASEKDTYKMEIGGEITSIARKYGISEERAMELLELPQYKIGGDKDKKKKKKKTITGEKQTALGENVFSTRKRERQSAGKEVYGDVESAEKALQQLYRNFPDLVYSDETLKNNVEIDNRGNLKFKNNIKLNTAQKVIGSLQGKMNDRMSASAQNVINNPGYYGEDAVKQAQEYLTNQTFNDKEIARGFDSKLGQFTSGRFSMGMNLVTPEDKKFLNDNGIFTLRQLKNSPLREKLSPDSLRNITDVEKQIGDTNADYSINQFNLKEEDIPDDTKPLNVGERPTQWGLLDLPRRTKFYPTLQPALKVATRYNEIEPVKISPEQQLAEADRTNVAMLSQLSENLSGSQAAAAGVGLAANDVMNRNKVISDTNRFNAAAQGQADNYNAQIGDREQDIENQNALSYEQRTLRGIANYENDLNNLWNQDYEDRVDRWKTTEMINPQNAYNPKVQYTGYGYARGWKPDLTESAKGYTDDLLQSGEDNKKGKEKGISTEKPEQKRFGGRFKKKRII